eukprot:5262676-Alexandrium_andersonii.AAC.1
MNGKKGPRTIDRMSANGSDPTACKIDPTSTESPRPTAEKRRAAKRTTRPTNKKIRPIDNAPPENVHAQGEHEVSAADRSARRRWVVVR